MHVKGLEMQAYHPNAAKGMALGYAVSERGACHLRGAPLTEVLGGADPLSIVGKAKLFREHQSESALWNSAVLCCFPSYGMSLKELWPLVDAATGFDYATVREVEAMGERINTLARYSAARRLCAPAGTPARNLSQPLQAMDRPKAVVELDPMLDEYYDLMGWDQNGAPTPERLKEMPIDQIAGMQER
jgi:aldehyde:ferredoxin oxidoreductase